MIGFMAESNEPNPLYRYPEFYDIIFSRDVSREVGFLIDVFSFYCDRTLDSYLDLGCGPGYHAQNAASRGVKSGGLDYSQNMIDFAKRNAERDGLQIDWHTGDMRSFGLGKPVDLVACLFDSIDGLLSIDDFVKHFQSVARNLQPDGLYVIGQMHQKDTPIIGYGPFHYHAKRDGKEISLDWATDVNVDTLSQTADVNLELRVKENGRTKVMRHRTRESFATPPFLMATARLSGVLEPFAWYGDFDVQQPYDDSEKSQHCISVFRKTAIACGNQGNGDI